VADHFDSLEISSMLCCAPTVGLSRSRSIESLTSAAFATYKAEIMGEMKIAHAG
jgi:hypothetical protein